MTAGRSQQLAEVVDVPKDAPSAQAGDDRLAARLRGFGPLGSATALVIIVLGPVLEPLAALLVLAWVRLSHTPWREIGYVRPGSWVGGLATGIVFGSAFKLVMKAIVMPLLGAPATNQAFHYVVSNPAAAAAMIGVIVFGAGFGEETVFRGFMFERLGKLIGTSIAARTATVLLSTAWFGIVHYPVQGFAGVEQALVTGLVFGAIFAVTGRIWTLMCAHAAFDLAALAIIYWDLESTVAHLVFK